MSQTISIAGYIFTCSQVRWLQMNDFDFFNCLGCQTFILAEIHCNLRYLKIWHIDCCAKFATGLKCSNRHRSKSMRVTKLFFCQIDPPMSASFWQKNRLDTQILFDLCLFEHFSPVANFAQQSIVTQPFVKFFCIGPIHFAKRLGKTEHIVYKFSW